MSVADASIGPKIIKSAKKEFLKHGYSQASLQTICKHAGVTTGALYKRYSGKAELFANILEPTVQRMLEMSWEHDKENREFVESNTAKSRWESAERVQQEWISFVYDNLENMQLLLGKSAGTKFEFFMEDFVKVHTSQTMKVVARMKELKQKVNDIEEKEIYIFYKGFWTAFFEPVVQGFTKSEAQKFISKLALVFDWNQIFGY